jgi:hypothetical protein
MKTKEITVLGQKVEFITTTTIEKIQAGNGAAPWKIGTSAKKHETRMYVNGEYCCNFGFDEKLYNHKYGHGYRQQIEDSVFYHIN